ncbi:hypothetical protein [Aquabacterium sp.]|uniref:hypothetical protein n=1 Tax=Aquabacterium sp. TaxID=1872578 RepID=UPI0035AF3717
MSRRARARREAMEAKYLAMASADDTDDMDWDDSDYESLEVYRDAENTDQEEVKCTSLL